MFQEKDITIGGWFVFFVLSAVPTVNIIVWLILLLGEKTNKSLKNLLKLQLIGFLIGIILVILFWGVIVASFGSMTYLL